MSLLFATFIAYVGQVGGATGLSQPSPGPVSHHYNPRWQEQAVTFQCDNGTRRLVSKETFNVKAQFVSADRSGRRVPVAQLRKVAQSLQGVLFWQIKPMCQQEGDLIILTGVRGPERVRIMLIWTETLFEVRQIDILK